MIEQHIININKSQNALEARLTTNIDAVAKQGTDQMTALQQFQATLTGLTSMMQAFTQGQVAQPAPTVTTPLPQKTRPAPDDQPFEPEAKWSPTPAVGTTALAT